MRKVVFVSSYYDLYTLCISLKQVPYSVEMIGLFERERVWESGESPLSDFLPLSSQERLSDNVNSSGRKGGGGMVNKNNQMQTKPKKI